MTAYYNENDPFAAAWLRELIKENLIAPGEVDERSIEEVKPDDLRGFTQCHFFAGIGVWSYALRNAGWADDTPVWTGSCPCQGFSASGQRGGFSDKRHLWPTWFRLIRECAPNTIFGEQVSSKDGLAWFDVVSADLENENYAIGAIDTCAAGVGAPHIRQRLYFVADASNVRRAQYEHKSRQRRTKGPLDGAEHSRPRAMADTATERYERGGPSRRRWSRLENDGELGHANAPRLSKRKRNGRIQSEAVGTQAGQGSERGSNIDGFWREAEWIYCKDGKYRPTKPGLFPLANGITGRVGLLRGAGNALCAPQAQAFIEAYLSCSVSSVRLEGL